jgi:hypothetical protein
VVAVPAADSDSIALPTLPPAEFKNGVNQEKNGAVGCWNSWA